MNYKIYHNPRCSKSREGLEILKSHTNDFEIVNYINNPQTVEEVRVLLQQLAIKPIELVRTQESIWKEHFKGKNITDNDIILALATYPKLIERPIIIKDNKAIIGRPLQKINKFL